MIDVRIELRITADTDTAMLHSIRGHIASAARDMGADEQTIDDFELVVSELATNVITHTDSGVVSIVFRHEDDRWILDVSEADTLDRLDAGAPSNDSIDGRGLFIAHALMDVVEIVDIEQRRYVRCVKTAA